MISKSIDGGFFSLDIEKLRQKIETLAWVDTVSVRKKWPSTLQLDIKEKQVAASWITSDNEKRTIYKLKKFSWDKKSLLSDKGIVFKSNLSEIQYQKYNKLVVYSSPGDLSVYGLKKCHQISNLIKKANLKLKNCFQDQRRSWFIEMENGFEVFLGRINNNLVNRKKDKIIQRVDTFLLAYKKILKKYEKNIKRIDMRYTNGFAVKWKSTEAQG